MIANADQLAWMPKVPPLERRRDALIGRSREQDKDEQHCRSDDPPPDPGSEERQGELRLGLGEPVFLDA